MERFAGLQRDATTADPTPTAVRAASDTLDRAAEALVSYGTRARLTGTAGAEEAFRSARILRSCGASQRRGMDSHCHLSLDIAAYSIDLGALGSGRPRFPEEGAIAARYAIADARRAQEAAGFEYQAPDPPPEREPLRVWTGDDDTPDDDPSR